MWQCSGGDDLMICLVFVTCVCVMVVMWWMDGFMGLGWDNITCSARHTLPHFLAFSPHVLPTHTPPPHTTPFSYTPLHTPMHLPPHLPHTTLHTVPHATTTFTTRFYLLCNMPFASTFILGQDWDLMDGRLETVSQLISHGSTMLYTHHPSHPSCYHKTLVPP